MKDIMRKHLWPASLVAALAVVGMLAAFVVLAGPERGTVEAQSACETFTGPILAALIAAGQCPATTPAASPSPTTGAGGGAPDPVAPGQPGATTPPGQTAEPTACSDVTGDALAALIRAGLCMEPTATPTITPTPTATPTATPVPPTATVGPTPTPRPTAAPPPDMDVADSITTDSSSAGAGVKVTLKIGNLPMNMRAGSSVVLYLEDDFNVEGGSIPRNTVYFTVTNNPDKATGEGGRVYATDPIEIEEDDYYGGDDDTSIRVYLPDFNTGDDYDGFQGPNQGQTLTMVIAEAGGIENPTEAHDNANNYVDGYKAGYAVLGVDGNVADTPPAANDVDNLIVQAKIGLNDADMTRGKELIVKGTGFNNGTSAAVHVLNAPDPYPAWWNSLNCLERNAVVGQSGAAADTPGNGYCQAWASLTATQQTAVRAIDLQGSGPAESTFCRYIIREGHRAGIAEVGSSDTVDVAFEVTVPIFGAGNTNYICMVDGEGRSASWDVEKFKLESSIRVSPSAASAGEKINVFAQDFSGSGNLNCLKIASQPVYYSGNTSALAANKCVVAEGNAVENLKTAAISQDGSAAISFDLPGSISGSALEGTVRIDATWGSVTEDAKVTVSGSILRLSQAEVRANESITIQGDGFGDEYVDAAKITIDGVALLVDDDSKTNNRVTVSNAGQFVVTVAVWPQDTSEGADNPALIAGTHTIRVEDNDGFFGTASLIIKEPSMTITPDVLGPRDYVTITGTDWPVDNADGGSNTNVDVTIDDDARTDDRRYSVIPDATGRFVVEHRVSRNVGIPSTNQVRATYGESVIVKVASFEVPAATIEITPTQGQPGDEVTMTVEGMKVYAEVAAISIGGADVRGGRSFRTDRDGKVTAEGLVIPGLDPGTYSVEMRVGSEEEQTVAIGSIEVQQEVVAGAVAELPGALEALDDNLEAVFYFDNVSKEWSFYDPREDFADLNTLSGMIAGQAYWILVGEAVDEVVLNGRPRDLTCSNGDCWNLVVW